MINDKQRILIPIFALFLIIACVCIGFIFAPVQQDYRSPERFSQHYNQWEVITQPAVSQSGLLLMAESWKRYPQYTIGLGAAAGLSFAGACYSVYLMGRAGE